ncbi:MAG: DUF3160 domain-containing protein [Ardenticatenaceae bacterium]|nr:DUF3160 domain-containing protein [Ardenticatenaceae bacterium]
MRRLLNLRLLVVLMLLLALAACNGGQEASTPAATAVPEQAEQADTAVPPTATPPVATPTIVIPTPEPEPTLTPEPVVVPEVTTSEKPVFAVFRETAVDTNPAIFHDPIAPDLGNVVVPFVLSEGQRARLAQDGMVVSPGVEKEFFTVYEQMRYANLPPFVTSDSLLHIYHLLFDKVLRTAEKESFIPLLASLNEAMLAQTDAQYQALKGSDWEDAALRTVAFIGVGSKLLDANTPIPAYAADLVEAEIANIEAASGIIPSPIFPGLENGEDYTQYIARGHYTTSEELTAYFKSMMWYGRMTFRLKSRDPEVGKAETRAALLLVQALRTAQVNGQPALDAWLDLYNPTVFFVGRSDDLTAFQYLDVIDAVYGPNADLAAIADESKLTTFIEAANQLPPPMILGLVISVTDNVEDVTKGFRFMGQRFVPDAYIFRQLIYRNVDGRMLPKGLDVMAAMGSDRAYTLLDEMGETEYLRYPEQMAKMQDWTASLTTEEWTETLYTTWLYSFYPLLEEPGAGYPQFMQTDAWLDKQLNTSLGSWAELKHDTILYAKQVYAELGGGGSNAPQPLLAQGYVEPVPEFFARISALTSMTLDGLDSRNLLNEQDGNSLQRLLELSDAFKLMAEKELRGEPLTNSEIDLIRFYGGELEHLTMAAADRDESDPNAQPYMDEEPQAAVVADVATAPDPDGDGVPNPVVLEEGVGRINEIYVVVPLITADGTIQLQVAKGGVFAYYEFPWPADDRLTDEKWRGMLDDGTAPDLPEWTGSFFIPETENAQLQRAIYNFQSSLSGAYWDLSTEWWLWNASPDVQAQFNAYFDELRAAKNFIGHQWIHASYRSFDHQSDTLAVVTVRETWEDKLYPFEIDPGDMEPLRDPINQRGPYTLDVTYTLEYIENSWQITGVVYANEPPAWEN